MIKISESRLRKQGERGYSITFPKYFAKDNNLKPGDNINIYRTVLDGKDAIVIIPDKSLHNTAVA